MWGFLGHAPRLLFYDTDIGPIAVALGPLWSGDWREERRRRRRKPDTERD
nr:hypothetical protein OG999_25020 [Streptomyces sp. NBC_00886]